MRENLLECLTEIKFPRALFDEGEEGDMRKNLVEARRDTHC